MWDGFFMLLALSTIMAIAYASHRFSATCSPFDGWLTTAALLSQASSRSPLISPLASCALSHSWAPACW